MGFLSNLLVLPVEKEEGDFNTYLEKLDSGAFKDKMFYGIAADRRGFLLLDPVQQPGALYCGGMGSGKSIAMRSTLVTHMAANSENTIYILVDILKGMTDYAILFDYDKNVATALNDPAKLIPAIEMTYHEMMSRKEEFSRVNANNIYSYEKIMKQKDPKYEGLARIILAIEEFHAVPGAEVIKYHMNVDRNGSPASMLKEILRVGRSYGIQLLAASQRATSDDFPSSLKPGITQLMAFRVNNPGDATAINLSQAADIRMEERGRCVYEGGFIQFPYIDDPTSIEILKRYYKPLKAKLLKYKMEDYHQAFSGEGNQGMVKVKTLKSLIENYSAFKISDIATRILEAFNFEVSSQKNKALPVPLIAKRDNTTYGILIIEKGQGGSKKAVENFKEALKLLNCDSMIAINITGSIPSDVASAKRELNGYDLDLEDLHRIADVLDNKEQLVRENKFDQMYEKLALVPLKGEIDHPKDENTSSSSPKKTESIDDLFSQFKNITPATPVKEEKKEVKQEIKAEVKPALETPAPKKENEETITRPVVATGGSSNLMDLRERLKASLKAKNQ